MTRPKNSRWAPPALMLVNIAGKRDRTAQIMAVCIAKARVACLPIGMSVR